MFDDMSLATADVGDDKSVTSVATFSFHESQHQLGLEGFCHLDDVFEGSTSISTTAHTNAPNNKIDGVVSSADITATKGSEATSKFNMQLPDDDSEHESSPLMIISGTSMMFETYDLDKSFQMISFRDDSERSTKGYNIYISTGAIGGGGGGYSTDDSKDYHSYEKQMEVTDDCAINEAMLQNFDYEIRSSQELQERQQEQPEHQQQLLQKRQGQHVPLQSLNFQQQQIQEQQKLKQQQQQQENEDSRWLQQIYLKQEQLHYQQQEQLRLLHVQQQHQQELLLKILQEEQELQYQKQLLLQQEEEKQQQQQQHQWFIPKSLQQTNKSNRVNTMNASEYVRHVQQEYEMDMPTGGELHTICIDSQLTWDEKLIYAKEILFQDPGSIRRPVTIRTLQVTTQRVKYNPKTKKVQLDKTKATELAPQPYKYPLNLAIYHNKNDNNNSNNVLDGSTYDSYNNINENERQAKYTFFELLILTDPSVITLPDGPIRQETTSLHLLFRHMTEETRLVDIMIVNNPICPHIVDALGNVPLHVIVQYATTVHHSVPIMEIVQHLLVLYPDALYRKNHNGMTPYELALQRSTDCPKAIMEYLSYQVKQQQHIINESK